MDPQIAARWHPNDRRKIRRSLEIYYQSAGKKTSEIYAAQRLAKAEASGAPSPFRNLIFWVHSENEVLKKRLDNRVDKMLDVGLWEEITEMDRMAAKMDAETLQNNAGIFQSIGFKEFKEYLRLFKSEEASLEEMEKAKTAALNDMKQATRRYAKTQVKWVRIKFINALDNARTRTETPDMNHLYLMNSTDVPAYDKNVTQPAVEITKGTPHPRSVSLFC